MDTLLQVTFDGGKSFKRLFKSNKHVDNHALWIDPDNTDHFIVGCDGGIYETFDLGQNYRFFENFPITQFYRVSVDNSKPFYYVYGGTQDNNSMGGPSRTLYSSGISNEDYFITVGGDGYETVVDPTNPNIVYSQWQYGGLVRYDRVSGERIDIQPQEEPGEAAHRWNWDSPVIISPHSPARLYFACQRLYRSDDRGNSWTAVSGDLSRQIDPNTLPVFGKIQSIDAVAKNMSTSNYGNIVSLTESPLVEDLIYVGTDDGLIQVTEDGGDNWRAIDQVTGRAEDDLRQPPRSLGARRRHRLRDLQQQEAGRLQALRLRQPRPRPDLELDHRRSAGSRDRLLADAGPRQTRAPVRGHRVRSLFHGRRGHSLDPAQGRAADDPGARHRHPAHRERPRPRHLRARLLHPRRLHGPLREVSEQALEKKAILFPAKDALRYVEMSSRLGDRGATFYTADNPPFGATFTYYLKDGFKTLEEQRIEAEKEGHQGRRGTEDPDLRGASQRGRAARTRRSFFTIRDSDGEVVGRIDGTTKKGMHRVTWNLRYPSARPVSLKAGESSDLGQMTRSGLSPCQAPTR